MPETSTSLSCKKCDYEGSSQKGLDYHVLLKHSAKGKKILAQRARTRRKNMKTSSENGAVVGSVTISRQGNKKSTIKMARSVGQVGFKSNSLTLLTKKWYDSLMDEATEDAQHVYLRCIRDIKKLIDRKK